MTVSSGIDVYTPRNAWKATWSHPVPAVQVGHSDPLSVSPVPNLLLQDSSMVALSSSRTVTLESSS